MNTQNQNPLAQWYRQPKIFVSLPSKGKFYPNGALDTATDNTYPVFSMTAKDELLFKTPDALLSGHSTVELIKSCVPAIIDPWEIPTIDLDLLLVAIRIATFGENMEVNCTCPACGHEDAFDVNLTSYIGKLAKFEYQTSIPVGELVFHVRPYNYRESTKNSLKAIEQQKIFEIINSESLDDEQKIDAVSQSFVKIVDLSVDVIARCVQSIETPNGVVTDQTFIYDFVKNADKQTFGAVEDHIKSIKEQIDFNVQTVKCSECKTEYEVPITMDQSDFFGVRS